MNIQFWSVIAQVSATFLGLIFVGVSVHLGNIREAIGKAEADLCVAEQSTRIMFVSVLNSLTFFLMPLIASLSLLAQLSSFDIPEFMWLLLPFVSYLFLIGGLLIGYRNSKTRAQIRLIFERAIETKELLRKRVIWGEWLMYIFGLLYTGVLIVLVTLKPSSILSWEYGLEILTCFSIFLGLTLGLLDLYFFQVKNILFEVSDKFWINAENKSRELKWKMLDVDSSYKSYEAMVQQNAYQKMLDQFPAHLNIFHEKYKELMLNEPGEFCSRYNKLREDIPLDHLHQPKPLEQIKEKSGNNGILRYEDITIFRVQSELLYTEIKLFLDELAQRLKSFEEPGEEAELQVVETE